MSGLTGRSSWYYRPTQNPNYPGSARVDPFLRQLPSVHKQNPSGTPVPGTATSRTPRTAHTPRSLGVLRSRDAEKRWVSRMSTPTTASQHKFVCPQICDGYKMRTQTSDGHVMWQKMDVFRDTYKCLWSRYGTVKFGSAI